MYQFRNAYGKANSCLVIVLLPRGIEECFIGDVINRMIIATTYANTHLPGFFRYLVLYVSGLHRMPFPERISTNTGNTLIQQPRVGRYAARMDASMHAYILRGGTLLSGLFNRSNSGCWCYISSIQSHSAARLFRVDVMVLCDEEHVE